MFAGDQPRKTSHAAGLDHKIVKAAAKSLAAIFDDPKPPPFGAINGRQLLKPDHAMRNAVHGLVIGLGRHVVEHQHGRLAAREIMPQGQSLPPIAQRALGKQPDFGEAVEYHPVR